jgi:hypothetical protein
MFETPIIFVVFNRPAKTAASFSRIAQMQPARLLVVADGPREGREGERELCEEVRRIATAVTWPCQLEVNFAESNLGCRRRFVTGLNWAFEQVEEAIILEDDILPDPSLFPFCREMLERYRDDDRVAMISGFNPVSSFVRGEASYYFSRLYHIWGWATWRNAWRRYDEHLSSWPEVKRAGILEEVFDSPRTANYWYRVFEVMYSGKGPNTWDYQWFYTNLIANRLAVVPRTNLVQNIGFDGEATHTKSADEDKGFVVEPLTFPLRHPAAVVPSRRLDRQDIKASGFFVGSLPARGINKLRGLLQKP